jgi:hypothetical protein
MVKSSIGAAWIMSHLPELASEAGISPSRKIGPEGWTQVANDANTWVYSINHGTRLFCNEQC